MVGFAKCGFVLDVGSMMTTLFVKVFKYLSNFKQLSIAIFF